MSRLSLRTVDDAPAPAGPRLTAALQTNGYLPNLLRLLANAPIALEAYQTLSALNTKTTLSPAEREAIQITAAAINGCGFCVAGHTAIAYKKIGLDDTIVGSLRGLSSGPDARLNAVAKFTKAVIRSQGNVADNELADFLAAGFDAAGALEVVLGVSLATLCNFSNNLGRPALNPELAPYAWHGAQAEAAQ